MYAFTGGIKEYAVPIFRLLDPLDTLFKNKLYKDSCNDDISKDLSKFGTNVYIPTRTLVIDDRVLACNPRENQLLIPEYVIMKTMILYLYIY